MRKRRDLGQPSDIAFLLIIFFLLLAGITATQSLDLTLLQTSKSQNLTEQTLTITVNADGSLSSGDQTLLKADFIASLHTKTHLNLSIEASTEWQLVVDLLSILEQHPVASLSLEVAG